jgi:Spy/CpxP family protein refolding chaperone
MPARAKRIVIALLLAAAAPAAAQESPRPAKPDAFRDMPSQLLKDLGQKLDLTDEQKAQVVTLKRAFEEKHRAKLKKLRQDVQRVRQSIQSARQDNDAAALKQAKGEAKALRQAGERLQREFEGQLLAVLTDGQRQQYAAFKAAPLETPRVKSTSVVRP